MKGTEAKVIAARAKVKPNYGRTAAELLAACRAFYEDPENEKKYQEWKMRKGEMKDGQAV